MTNLQKLLVSYVNSMQLSENTAHDVLTKSGLSSAIGNISGAQLDNYGKFIDEPRRGADDAQYRLRIVARITANASRGTIEDVLATIRRFQEAVVGTVTTYSLRNSYPAGVIVDLGFVSPDLTLVREVGVSVQASVAGGVRGMFFFDTSDKPFTFGAFPIPADNQTGLGVYPMLSLSSSYGALSGVIS